VREANDPVSFLWVSSLVDSLLTSVVCRNVRDNRHCSKDMSSVAEDVQSGKRQAKLPPALIKRGRRAGVALAGMTARWIWSIDQATFSSVVDLWSDVGAMETTEEPVFW
jgi:hypothetical protein